MKNKQSLSIAMLSPFDERVPPLTYGGIELVIYNLVENLTRMGHEVTLFASGDSQTSAKLVPIFTRSIRNIPEARDRKMKEIYKFIGTGKTMALLHKKNFDIVHNHIGWRILCFEKTIDIPMVTTLHGPLDDPYQAFAYGKYADSNYVSISLNQRQPMLGLNYTANVYNGIDVSKFKFFPSPKDYFVFLGRMSPEKGPVQAIQVAKKAGVKLLMAAKVDAVDEEFYKKEVEPNIDGKQIKYVGEVDHEEKLELLGNAKGLIAPIQWEEPFGLFFIEAMVCGTPVFALRRGSVPELVIDKKTGFICDNLDELAQKIGHIDSINRNECHLHVVNNFSSEKMTQGYVAAYEKILSSKKNSAE